MSTITKEQVQSLVDRLRELNDIAEGMYKVAPADSYAEHYLGSVGDDLTNAYDAAHQLLRTFG